MRSLIMRAKEKTQKESCFKVMDMIKGSDLAIRVCRFDGETFVFELVKECEPVGYIMINSLGQAFRCNTIKKGKTCSYYLNFATWDRISLAKKGA